MKKGAIFQITQKKKATAREREKEREGELFAAATNMPAHLFRFVSCPCFVSERPQKYFGSPLFVFIFTKDGGSEREVGG